MNRMVTNWGNYPRIAADWLEYDQPEPMAAAVRDPRGLIARGLGRCYGDSALAPRILSTQRYNKFLAFDAATGHLTCQAGVALEDILAAFIPRGWFLPVTPGTKYVTVGGAIAADVHGKNHHKEGSFGDHVTALDLLQADGRVVTCTPTDNAELFETTRGGMGLTGVILRATLRLKRIATSYIREETIRAPDLAAIMDLFEDGADWTYSVAWIDCLATGRSMGRSIMMRGEHARPEELQLAHHKRQPLRVMPGPRLDVPFMFPGLALNPLTVRAFNTAYYHKHPAGAKVHITDYDTFFYPLDFVNNWNRIYGRRGFTQYQLVIPRAASRRGLPAILQRISQSGLGSFLAVLKLFGPQNGLVSFPMEGYTLALDFPMSRRLLPCLDAFDRLVLEHGGRLYLAKDVRMSAAMFQQGYPNAAAFKERVRRGDPQGIFHSLQSRRIGVTP